MRLVQTFIFTVALASSVFGAENIGPLELQAQATAGSKGVYLSDLVAARPDQPVPEVLLAPAPEIGRPYALARHQINELLKKAAPDLACTNWTGADRIKVTRAVRVVDETVLKDLLTSALQNEHVKDRGELELRFTRAWKTIVVPDEVLSLRILELPTSGVSVSFICRFELLAGEQVTGTYQQPLRAAVWKDVYVARSNVPRGELLREADIGLERRDILSNRDFLSDVPLDNPYIEFRENVQGGMLLTPRVFRLRAIVKRGRIVDALVEDESLSIAVKAEVLEDGVPGQIVRLRNLRSRREFKGKVQDEQTVSVLF